MPVITGTGTVSRKRYAIGRNIRVAVSYEAGQGEAKCTSLTFLIESGAPPPSIIAQQRAQKGESFRWKENGERVFRFICHG